MVNCIITILDEVNIKIQNLDLDTRKSLVKKFKFEDPTARFRPSHKLGRWDGTVSFFSIGGYSYLGLIEPIIEELSNRNYEIEIDDLRTSPPLTFEKISEDFWGDKVWPKNHRFEGDPIRLRSDQVDVVNKFLENPQCVQQIATGFGKTITTATLAKLAEKIGRTVVIVPNKSLVEQTEEDFLNVGLDFGVYYGDRKEIGKTHTICTWQSLNILDKKSKISEDEILTITDFLEDVRCVIVDECFDGDTLITTPQGKKPIKDIKPGDKIINLCEKTKQYKEDIVIKLHKNLSHSIKEKMLELEFDNGIKIKVTANHKFLTDKGWIRADELTTDLEIKTQNKIKKLYETR
jgi:hypothetical protein